MREWLRGGAPPCQGGGRGFESRLALLFFFLKRSWFWPGSFVFMCFCVTGLKTVLEDRYPDQNKKMPQDQLHPKMKLYLAA